MPYQEAIAHVLKCQQEPGVHLNDPLTLASAECVWTIHHETQHQCYWNDRFVAAVMCGMSEEHQRRAARIAVQNGITGYWEWKTHYGFDTSKVLTYLGIIPFDYSPILKWDYSFLPRSLCSSLSDKFNLQLA